MNTSPNRLPFANTPRLVLANRRPHITQKVKIAGQRTLYLSVHDDPHPKELFLRVKGLDVTSETVGLYDVIARLMSLALQYGAPLAKVGDLLAGAKFTPCGPVSGHDRLKQCSSLPDLIGRHLLMEYCDRGDLAHTQGVSPPDDRQSIAPTGGNNRATPHRSTP